jgi:hypothetical protein
MPLINFRTNLKSLKYGADRPGGGSSEQPFVQFPIEDASTPPQFRTYYELNRTSLDFPVRGGAITNLLQEVPGIISSTIDRERIQKFFNSAPRGKAFIEKQKGLQLTNPRIQVPNSLAFVGTEPITQGGENPAPGVFENIFLPTTNIYEPTSTLAQVQVMGTGAHFNRHGFVPSIYQSPLRTYAYIVGNPENNTATTNRLAILKTLKLGSNLSTGIDPVLINRLGISPLQQQLFNYPGGPGSVYGIGFTRIFRVSDTRATELFPVSTKGFTINGQAKPVGVTKPYSAIALTYQQLATQGTRTTNPEAPTRAKIQDFRRQTNNGSPVIVSSDYTNYNIANPAQSPSGPGMGIGNPGSPLTGSKYTDVQPLGADLLNLTDPLTNKLFYNPGEQDPWTVVGSNSKDIIKFAFECIDNNNINNTLPLIFRAFLEGQITDNHTAEYSSFKYLGRGETFRTYQGFDRSISFSFRIFVQSRQEMRPLYKKLNQLISQVYPDYSPSYGIMRGNVVRLTIGDYIYRTPGFLENVNITIDNSNTPWEILLNLNNEEEFDVRQLPHMVTIQCSFKPIMDLLPRKVDYTNQFVPLIANKDNYLNPAATGSAAMAKLLIPVKERVINNTEA